MDPLNDSLERFTTKNRFKTKGPLSVALVVTRHAKQRGLPLDPDQLLTKGGGQVLGLGKAGVQAVLREHGITRVLAEEGGRTSRGSVGAMKKYVVFLNNLHGGGLADLDAIENWWIDRVRAYFASKPFVLHFDPSRSLRAIIRDLLAQAQRRQEESPGATFSGTILQHLIGAKLDLALPLDIDHHGASVADDASGRSADFLIQDTAIHVTTAPGEAVIRKCVRNLGAGLRPVVVTTHRGIPLAEGLSEQAGIADRVDIFEAEQFIAGNLYELGEFAASGRRIKAEELIERYNEIINECETDPGLRIELGD